MDSFYSFFSAIVLLSLVGAAFRVAKGPARADRMMAGQLLGTSCVTLLLIQAEQWEQPALRNLALIFVALAALTTVAFVRFQKIKKERA